ncbi:MAG TPA: aryl-sulfate sulfotransferase [Oceanicaulis sp.]|jgi:predicted DNA-binding ribbon-helix-helix protein|uniref:Ribbon-helix-helix domain-containing protein n=1 Tax=Glycocaulis albus TaxID=1382801 RepID=A0ABQ1XMW0_9PROT|nr:ribbon-helix-helix domain-containing protein [Glycocaulis albus]MBV5259088.1 ribbon-helix-helix domain-containing protein [Synechococcus moorigangaii CMS01]GGG98135.1 hypothetical protein GCM10007420_12410 [Glycocaulis albus]HCY57125.1 aryl-sulfate sulfotransferase [Oceanicaulis sp.]
MSQIKRSLSLAGHRTSLALEPEFWAVLDAACAAQGRSLASLIGEIDEERVLKGDDAGLASACRVWALRQAQSRA